MSKRSGFAYNGRMVALSVRSKHYMTKFTFVAAVERPHELPKFTFFNGLLGAWAFMKTEVEGRSSTSQPAGSPVLKVLNVDEQTSVDIVAYVLFLAAQPAQKRKNLSFCGFVGQNHVFQPQLIDGS